MDLLSLVKASPEKAVVGKQYLCFYESKWFVDDLRTCEEWGKHVEDRLKLIVLLHELDAIYELPKALA
jgi:hypothetical protein